MGERIELPITEIVEKWKRGETLRKLGEEYGVSGQTIYLRIKEYYRETGKEEPMRKKTHLRINIPIKEIVEKRKNGVTLKNLAEEYNVSRGTIYLRIKEYYEETGHKTSRRTQELPIKEIVDKWENGVTQKELAGKYGVSKGIISSRIKEYYVREGKQISSRKRELPIEEIVTKWENGLTQKQIGEEYGVLPQSISHRIREYYKQTGKQKPERKIKQVKKEIAVDEYYQDDEKFNGKARVLRSFGVVVEYLKKGLTPEQIKEIAGRKNITIPEEIMQKAMAKVEGSKNIRTKQGMDR